MPNGFRIRIGVVTKSRIMKIKFMVIGIMLSLVTGLVQAQIFHLKGASAISAAGGITGSGIFGELGYQRFFSSKVYLKIAGNYESAKVNGASVSSTLLDIEIFFGLNPGGGRFFINGGFGPSTGYEKVSGLESESKIAGMKYGFLVTLEPEIYVSNKVGIIIPVSQRLYFQESLTRKKFNVGLGLRVLF